MTVLTWSFPAGIHEHIHMQTWMHGAYACLRQTTNMISYEATNWSSDRCSTCCKEDHKFQYASRNVNGQSDDLWPPENENTHEQVDHQQSGMYVEESANAWLLVVVLICPKSEVSLGALGHLLTKSYL